MGDTENPTKQVKNPIYHYEATLEEPVKTKKIFSTSSFVAIGLVAGIVLLITFSVGIAAATGAFEDDDEVFEGFCADSGISDSTVRQILADNFDDFDNGILDYSGIELLCLPPNAFGNLKELDRLQFMETVIDLRFVGSGIKIIHPNAFSGEVIKVIYLDLSQNNLEEMFTNSLLTFSSLLQIMLDNNDFKTLDNDAFGPVVNNNLQGLSLNNCDRLVRVPGVVRFLSEIRTLRTNDCAKMKGILTDTFKATGYSIALFEFFNTPYAEQPIDFILAQTGLPRDSLCF